MLLSRVKLWWCSRGRCSPGLDLGVAEAYKVKGGFRILGLGSGGFSFGFRPLNPTLFSFSTLKRSYLEDLIVKLGTGEHPSVHLASERTSPECQQQETIS